MTLVPAAAPTADQHARWTQWLGREVERIESFCLDERLTSRADVAKCIAEGACKAGPSRRTPEEDEEELPHLATFKHAVELCEAQGKRLPRAEEWLWAAAGGEEDRRYPWGGEPLDGSRAAVFDQGDHAREVSLLEFECKENPKGDWCFAERECVKSPDAEQCVADKEGIARGEPATIRTPFPWDDGFSKGITVDAFPDGDGRWGHRQLYSAEVVVFDSREEGARSGRLCGTHLPQVRPGAIPNLHGETLCGVRRAFGPFRCAGSPQVGDG